MMPPGASTSGFAEFLIAHASLLESLHLRSNAARWTVSYEEFAAALYRSAAHRFGTSDNRQLKRTESYLRALHLEDLALACALRRGSETAWEQFIAEYRPILQAAARAIVGAGGEARARELADSLYAELYGLDRWGRDQKKSLLDYFHGRSRLTTWLRSVLAQRHVDALRASQRLESLDDQRVTGGVRFERANTPIENVDPDRVRLLPRLVEAISEALAALPAADRLLLSLYYVQRLTLAQIARMRDVHEATASRRLQDIRLEVRQGVESVLARGSAAHDGRPATKGLSPAEIRRCLDYALEDWSFDLTSTLAENAAPGRSEGK